MTASMAAAAHTARAPRQGRHAPVEDVFVLICMVVSLSW
jgi:hypothetical protein